MQEKIKSRKLWLTVILINIIFFGPMIYKAQGISDQVALWALGAISALGSTYLGANILQKKFIGSGDDV